MKAWDDLVGQGITFYNRKDKSKYYIDFGVMIERDNVSEKISIKNVMSHGDRFRDVSWSERMTFKNKGWFEGCYLVCLNEFKNRIKPAEKREITTRGTLENVRSKKKLENIKNKVEYYEKKLNDCKTNK
jgi:hypothetical protein